MGNGIEEVAARVNLPDPDQPPEPEEVDGSKDVDQDDSVVPSS